MATNRTVLQHVTACLWNRWLTGHGLQQRLAQVCGVYISESSATRRIRDLREDKNGGWNIQKRPASKGSACLEYRLMRTLK